MITAVERAAVLLVEDDPDQAYLTSRMVARGTSFEVTRVASDVASAVSMISHEPPDCVLLDLTLPDAVGLDTLEQIQRIYPGPIVVLSGEDDSDVAVEAVRRGAQDFLVKDQVDADRLDRTLRYTIERWADKTRLEELSRAKDQFLAVVSHELRTPLTPLVGFAKILSANDLSPSEQGEILGLITEQAEQLQAIIEDLLVAARSDIGGINTTITSVDLAEIGERAIRAHAGERPVRLTCEGAPVLVRGDVLRVAQIARSLLINALRYGGPQIEVRVYAEEGVGVLEVIDDGAGVPPSEVERIFRPYERLDHARRDPGSMGLGLPIAAHLAGLMDGTVEYRWRNDRSVFGLRLPT